jgi:mannose-6-phosphate isomerase class I
MFMIVRKSQDIVEKYSYEKQSLDQIIAKELRISVDVADVVKHYEKIKTDYNRIYYVSDGLMQLHINNQDLLLHKGDACFIEKGMIVEIQGTFAVIIVSTPTLYLVK